MKNLRLRRQRERCFEAAKEEQKAAQRTILGLSKSTFFWVLSIFILLVGTFIFDQYQQNRSDELEQKNKILK